MKLSFGALLADCEETGEVADAEDRKAMDGAWVD